MKYIFVAGAPGSKWSSVVKNIYWSSSIDHTDYNESRTYYHDAAGTLQLMHLGAYWDPGMEFGSNFENLSQMSKAECEAEFDRPFFVLSGPNPIRIVKSHVFCYHLDFLKNTWPECPIVLVHRENDACLGWWVRCGHFDITYPNYQWYQNLSEMGREINQQNSALKHHWHNNAYRRANNNQHLARLLGIDTPPAEYRQDYEINDIKVAVI
jgi:hypothetical protein